MGSPSVASTFLAELQQEGYKMALFQYSPGKSIQLNWTLARWSHLHHLPQLAWISHEEKRTEDNSIPSPPSHCVSQQRGTQLPGFMLWLQVGDGCCWNPRWVPHLRGLGQSLSFTLHVSELAAECRKKPSTFSCSDHDAVGELRFWQLGN